MLNGEKNNYLFNAGVALAIGLIVSALIFGWFYSRNKRSEEAITVTGSAKKRITSDLVVWSADVSAESATLTDAFKQIADGTPKLKQYLVHGDHAPTPSHFRASLTATSRRKS